MRERCFNCVFFISFFILSIIFKYLTFFFYCIKWDCVWNIKIQEINVRGMHVCSLLCNILVFAAVILLAVLLCIFLTELLNKK